MGRSTVLLLAHLNFKILISDRTYALDLRKIESPGGISSSVSGKICLCIQISFIIFSLKIYCVKELNESIFI